MWTQHLPEPQLQFKVYDEVGNLIGITDFAWPEFGLLGEFDGKIKYGRLLKDGETAERRRRTREGARGQDPRDHTLVDDPIRLARPLPT